MRLWSALRRVNPVAKLFATLPAAVALFVTRGVFVPAAFIVLAVAATLLFGAIGRRRVLALLCGIVVAAGIGSVLLGLWVPPAESQVLWSMGPFALSQNGLATGVATALRVIAIVTLMLLSGFTTTSRDLLLSLQQQLRVPYRYVYAVRTALTLGPFMAENLRTITLAHKVRGTVAARGPAGWIARQSSYAVPLLAGGIRHGERLALAMDARAFGVSPSRTERRTLRWRPSDTAFIAAGWALTLSVYLAAAHLGLLGTLALW